METPRRMMRNLHMGNIKQLSTPLKIPASPLMKRLGYGTGVNVYRLDRSPKRGEVRSPLALKRVSRVLSNNADLIKIRIQEEASILRELKHPNIVGFLGITTDKDGIDSLILECCKTSLGTILEDRNDSNLGPLEPAETLKMIVDVAKGLDYLHIEAQLLHGDLKSFNVLVKGDFEICKLCDFGVSLPIDDDGVIDFKRNPKLRYVGTNLWSAPEIMDELDVIDCKADMFSFGLIIYETIALVPPHFALYDNDDTENAASSSASLTAEDSINSAAATEEELSIAERLDRACGTRPPLPQAFELSDAYNSIVEIFYCCTNELPEDRPLAKTIWQSLEQKEQPEKKDE